MHEADRGRFPPAASVMMAVAVAVAAAPGVPAPAAALGGGRVFLPAVLQHGIPTAAVEASPGRGIYLSPVVVSLSTSSPAATIRYTTDGSIPTRETGIVYRGPLPVGRTTVLRAAAFLPRHLPSPTLTETYIFPADTVRQPRKPPGFPKSWGFTDDGEAVAADYEMDPRVAVDDPRYRDRIVADLMSLPSVSVVTPPTDMFAPEGIYSNSTESGREWERPASVELLYPSGKPGFQVDCGIRVAGDYSRDPEANRKHSFSLRFRKEYGAEKLRFPLFPDSQVDRFDALRLRAGQADSFEFFPRKAQYIHDEWGRDTQRAMGSASADGIFVHLYVNGLYWGLYNLAQEVDAEFAAQTFGGHKDDYDVIKQDIDLGPKVEAGDRRAFDRMLAVDDLGSRAGWEEIQRYLDVVQYIDYTILELYGANRDWPHNNWIALRQRGPNGRFRFFVWDIEQMTQLWRYDAGEDRTDSPGAAGLHGRLVANSEYRRLFGDRVHKHLGPGGALSPPAARARYARLALEVESAIVPESARWGDVIPGRKSYAQNRDAWDDFWWVHGRGHPQTLDDEWRPERDRIVRDFFAARTPAVLDQLRRRGLYPAVEAPLLERRGVTLRMRAPAGKVYYTFDGTDPRRPGGSISPAARVYKGPMVVAGYARVMARALDGTAWSALAEAVFGQARVDVSEIMYHPADGEEHEFIELYNPLASSVDLSGAAFTDGVDFAFPQGAQLRARGYLVLAADAAAFGEAHPGVPLAGVYDGRLANGGERLTLQSATGAVLADVTYDDDGLWPVAADGLGFSLVPQEPGRADPWRGEDWRASTNPGGSPGGLDPPGGGRRVVVSEVLSASRPPYEDAIEVENLTGADIDISGWFLSDDAGDADALRKFRIPDGTVLGPGGRRVFYEADFRTGAPGAFGLSSAGEAVYLSEAGPDGGTSGDVYGFSFGPQPANRSVGRVATSAGAHISPLERPSFGVTDPSSVEEFRAGTGAPNAPAYVGPAVVSEVMYHPGAGGAEFVEITNATAAPVPLFAPGRTRDTWHLEGGIAFAFPPGMVLPPGGRVLVVAGDPDAFRRGAGAPLGVPVLGPFEGRLGDAADVVRLARPIHDEGAEAPLLAAEDIVAYRDRSPWPPLADGAGPSLERLSLAAFGSEAANWVAVANGGTPGRDNSTPHLIFLPFSHQR